MMQKIIVTMLVSMMAVSTSHACDELPEKLKNCEAYSCEQAHPLMKNFQVTHTIYGPVSEEDARCHYTQTMPNNGLMNCAYSEKSRVAAAIVNAQQMGNKITIEATYHLADGTIETLNDNEAQSFYAEASGKECEITGYN